MKPIKLTGGYAYANTERKEVLVCTVDDDGPAHAYTLTADDLAALLTALGARLRPAAAYQRQIKRLDGAQSWLDTLPQTQPAQPQPSVPKNVQSAMNRLYKWICYSQAIDDGTRLDADTVFGFIDGLSQPQADAPKQPSADAERSAIEFLQTLVSEKRVYINSQYRMKCISERSHGYWVESLAQAADYLERQIEGVAVPQDGDELPPWALTPEQWAELDEGYVCAAVDRNGQRWLYDSRPRSSRIWWMVNEGQESFCLDTVDLQGAAWRDTLTWRPGHEPKD